MAWNQYGKKYWKMRKAKQAQQAWGLSENDAVHLKNRLKHMTLFPPSHQIDRAWLNETVTNLIEKYQ